MVNSVSSALSWRRNDLETDRSWIQPLEQAAVDDFRRALEHALTTRKPLLQMSKSDFPIREDGQRALSKVLAATQGGYGIALVRGVPIAGLAEDEARVLFWGIGLHLGVARPQGKNSQFMSDVRAEGGEYRSPTGRGYNTNASLDFHSDAADIVALLCLRDAKTGGESLVTSSIAARNEMMQTRPDLVEVLYRPFVYSRQGSRRQRKHPISKCPSLENATGTSLVVMSATTSTVRRPRSRRSRGSHPSKLRRSSSSTLRWRVTTFASVCTCSLATSSS